MGKIRYIKQGYDAYKEGREYYDKAKQATEQARQTYHQVRSPYDQGSQIYDRRAPQHSTDPADVLAREANPVTPEKREKRQKLAEQLRTKAERLQALENDPSYNYVGKDGSKKESKWKGVRKKGIIFGGTAGAGLLGGLGMFSTTLGPLQLIHMSEILSGYHMGPQEDDSNQSTFRLLKYAYHYSKGQAEKSRLGFVSNKLADSSERFLNSVGLTSKYTRAGLFEGIVIDKTNPRFKGLNDDQIKQIFKEQGATIKSGSEVKGKTGLPADSLVIDQRDITSRQMRQFISGRLREGGKSGVSAYVHARIMNKRFGKVSTLLHPMKALDEKTMRIEEKVVSNFKERLLRNVRGGKQASITTNLKEGEKASDAEKAAAGDVQKDINSTIDDASKTEKEVLSGDKTATKKLGSKFLGKTGKAAGALAILSLPCILKSLNENYSARRHELQYLPLAANAAQELAVGQQAAGSVDATAPQMGPWADRLSGTDRFGNPASAFDADAITAMTGEAEKNQPPPKPLARIMESEPFPLINREPIKSALVGICSAEVQAISLTLSIITGPFSTAGSIIASSFAINAVESEYEASWASNTPFNPFDSGPDQGNDLAYGTLILANQNSLATGGSPLPAGDIQQIHSEAQKAQNEEFQSKSLAYRLFNPRDYRTPVGRFIDSQHQGSFLSTFAGLFTNVTNMSSSFGSTLLNTVSGRGSAAPRVYGYSGMGTVGFGPAIMNDTGLEKVPNVDQAGVALLEGDGAQKWIDQAKKCKGVNVAKDSDNRWNVTSDSDSVPKIEDTFAPECFQGSSKQWDLLSMFINYTVQANATDCSFTGDDTSCAYSGVGALAAGGGGSSGGGIATGDAKSLAKQLWDEAQKPDGHVKFQGGNDGFNGKKLKEIADKGTQTTTCKELAINPDLLGVLVSLMKTYTITIGVFGAGHESIDKCTDGQHPLGNAVDINGVAKGNVSTGATLHWKELNAEQMALGKEFYQAVANLFPEKEGGMGQYTAECFGSNLPPKRDGVSYFADSCDHLHIDVRKN